MKLILTDIDNTLLSFSPQFELWAEKQGLDFVPGVLGQTYDFEPMFPNGIDVDQLLNDFFDCQNTMETFGALENTVEPIQRMRDRGFEFIAITACEHRPYMRKSRLDNLRNVFGFDFDDIFITGMSLPKSSVLQRYDPAIWVEDNLSHAIDGANHGHETFLIDHPYNKGDGPFTRVRDWLEIEEAICTVNSR